MVNKTKYFLKKHFVCSSRGKQQCLAFGFSHLIYPHTRTHVQALMHRPHPYTIELHSMIAQQWCSSQRLYPLSILFYFIFALYLFLLSMKIVLFVCLFVVGGGLETITWYYLAQNINKTVQFSGIVRFSTFKTLNAIWCEKISYNSCMHNVINQEEQQKNRNETPIHQCCLTMRSSFFYPRVVCWWWLFIWRTNPHTHIHIQNSPSGRRNTHR